MRVRSLLQRSSMTPLVKSLFFLLIFLGRGSARRETDDKFRRGVATGALAGWFAVLVHSFFDFTLHTTSNALLFLILAALATQDSRVNEGSHGRSHRLRSSSPAAELEVAPAQPPALEEAKPA